LVALDEGGDKLGSIVGRRQNRDKHGLGWDRGRGLGRSIFGRYTNPRYDFAEFRQNLSLRIYNIYVV